MAPPQRCSARVTAFFSSIALVVEPLTANAQRVLEARYRLRDEPGRVVEVVGGVLMSALSLSGALTLVLSQSTLERLDPFRPWRSPGDGARPAPQ